VAKATIKKGQGGWNLTRPGYGFHGPTSTGHDSQAAAISALYQRQVSGGSSTITETLWVPTINHLDVARPTHFRRWGSR
jgi:hypothetical protein